MSISMQNISFITQFILEILQKTLHTYFEYFWHIWPHSSKIVVSFKENCDAQCNKNQVHSSFLSCNFCRVLANLLLWAIWAGIAWSCPPRLMVSTCRIVWCFIYMQKITFILPFFFEILQRYYKLAILGILGMPSYDK